jgi:hypothetical protein
MFLGMGHFDANAAIFNGLYGLCVSGFSFFSVRRLKPGIWRRLFFASVIIPNSIKIATGFRPSLSGALLLWAEYAFEALGILLVGYLVVHRERLLSGSPTPTLKG